MYGNAAEIDRLCSPLACDERCEVGAVYDAADRDRSIVEAYCTCAVSYMRVRVQPGLKCNTLNPCDYNNGGCEQTCVGGTNVNDYRCQCDAGYRLDNNGRSCTPLAGCDLNNGGCEQRCVRGNPDSCACNSGFRLSPNGRDCIDIDECANDPSICANGNTVLPCVNTYGNYTCLRLTPSSGGQASALSSLEAEGDVESKATGLQKNIDGVSRTADHLTISFFALFAWVAVVTVALLTVVAVGCRRWRRHRRHAAADWHVVEDDVDRRSTGDASSVCSRPTTDDTAAVAVCRDRTAFEGVEIGRRVSPQSSVDDALTTGGASSAAGP